VKVNPILSSKLVAVLLVVFTVFALSENVQFADAEHYDLSLINNNFETIGDTLVRSTSIGDDGIGIAVGAQGLIAYTTNDGVDWIRSDVDGVSNVLYSVAISQSDSNIGIAVGEQGTIIHTTDGGQNWEISDVSSLIGTDTLYGVSMGSNGVGIAVGDNNILLGNGGVTLILYTTDGGETWSKSNTISLNRDNALYSVSMNGNDGVAVGKHGIMIYTDNGGVSWGLGSINFTFYDWNSLLGVSLDSNGNAIAVGYPKLVFKTTDGGANWISSDPIGNKLDGITPWPLLREVSIDSSGKGVMVGDNGITLYTTDTGDTWTWVDTSNILSSSQHFYGVSLDSNGQVVIVGQCVIAYSLSFFDPVPDVISGTTCYTISNTINHKSCADCTPPTFGLNQKYDMIVKNGFTYNGNSVDVTNYHTEYPLITVVTNQTNTVTVKVYENSGVNSIENVQFGMGMPKVGSSLDAAQTLVEVWLDGTQVDEIVKIDKNNLVDIINATSSEVPCSSSSTAQCLEVSLQYIYRDKPKYNVMAINAIDIPGNSQTNYINDGILVIGESLNEPLLQTVAAGRDDPLYPQKTGNILLTQVDYKTDMWQDEYGYMWSGDGYRPTLVNDVPLPIQEPDNYSKWSGYNDRAHSEFDSYLELQKEKAISTMIEAYPNYNIIKPNSEN